MVIEIVDFPIENSGSFHSYVNVYQRVKTHQFRKKYLENQKKHWFRIHKTPITGFQPSQSQIINNNHNP